MKTPSNGNQVVDGKIMGWFHKLKSMVREASLFSLYRAPVRQAGTACDHQQDRGRHQSLDALRQVGPSAGDHPHEALRATPIP